MKFKVGDRVKITTKTKVTYAIISSRPRFSINYTYEYEVTVKDDKGDELCGYVDEKYLQHIPEK